MQDYMVLWSQSKNCYSMAGKFQFIHRMHHTSYLQNSIYFSLQNSLKGKSISSLEDCKRHLEQFFAQKDKKFWEDGITKLPQRWQKVVEQNSEYFIVVQ